MPDRILHDLTDSDAYNAASVQARDLFIRLINKADDYGCQVADARRLRPLLYPLLLDQVREADLQRWIAECVKSGLVRQYDSEGRDYLQIAKWRQRTRGKPKFPAPPWGLDGVPEKYRTVASVEVVKTAVTCLTLDGESRANDGESRPEAYANADTNAEAQPQAADRHQPSENALKLARETGLSGNLPPSEIKRFSDLVERFGVDPVREAIRAAYTRKPTPIGPGPGLIGWISSRVGGRAAEASAAKMDRSKAETLSARRSVLA